MEEELIIRSKLRWYVNPVIFLSLAIIGFVVVDILTGAVIGKGLLSMGHHVGPRAGRGLGYLLSIPILGFTILWSMRRIYVFRDRIEVKFPLHRKRNYDILLKNVDCYCVERVEVETKHELTFVDQIYLLQGRKLWLYITESDCGNFDKMLTVLEENCGIPRRDGSITLSKKDKKIIKRGGCIELEDITDEELILMAERRKNRKRLQQSSVVEEKKWNFDLTGWRNIVIAASFFLLLFCVIKVFSLLKTNNEEHITYLSATSPLPHKQHLIIDSIDVDFNGICYRRIKNNIVRNFNGVHLNTLLCQWAFKVKGREDVLIILSTEFGVNDTLSANYLRSVCSQIFRKSHHYTIIDDGICKDQIIHYIQGSNRYRTINKKAMIIDYDDISPVMRGSYLYYWSLDMLSFHRYKLALEGLEQAAGDGVCEAALRLGYLYKDGEGVELNLENAVKWFCFAADQRKNGEIRTKALNALNSIGYMYVENKDYEIAIAVLNKAIQIDSINANLYDSKGEVLYRKGDKEGAKAMWQKVISLDPDFGNKYDSDLQKMLFGKEKGK